MKSAYAFLKGFCKDSSKRPWKVPKRIPEENQWNKFLEEFMEEFVELSLEEMSENGLIHRGKSGWISAWITDSNFAIISGGIPAVFYV